MKYDQSVIVTRLWTGRLTSTANENREFFFTTTARPAEVHPASYLVVTGASFPQGLSCWRVTLATHIHLVPRLRTHGAMLF